MYDLKIIELDSNEKLTVNFKWATFSHSKFCSFSSVFFMVNFSEL